MTRRGRGFTIIEVFVVLALLVAIVGVLLPTVMALRERARKAVEEAGVEVATVVVTPKPPTVEEMEEAAEDAAEEHNIYDRVVALAENVYARQLTVRVVDSLSRRRVELKYNGNLEMVQVFIDGKMVYKQIDGEILIYLSMGKWEHLLGNVERKVAADREENFRVEHEKRFGSLPGWDSDG